jgi:hypothetical protein
MCKSYAHKALCVNLLLYAKLKDNGPMQVMSQIRLHKGFIQSTYLIASHVFCHKHPPSSHQLNDNVDA